MPSPISGMSKSAQLKAKVTLWPAGAIPNFIGELSDLETLWLIVHATKVMDKDQTTLHATILKETETNE